MTKWWNECEHEETRWGQKESEKDEKSCVLCSFSHERNSSVLHTEMSWGAAARSLTESRQRQKLQCVKKRSLSDSLTCLFCLHRDRAGYFSSLMSFPHYIHDTDWFPENPSTTKPSELCIAAISNASNSSKSCTEAETSHFEKEIN